MYAKGPKCPTPIFDIRGWVTVHAFVVISKLFFLKYYERGEKFGFRSCTNCLQIPDCKEKVCKDFLGCVHIHNEMETLSAQHDYIMFKQNK